MDNIPFVMTRSLSYPSVKRLTCSSERGVIPGANARIQMKSPALADVIKCNSICILIDTLDAAVRHTMKTGKLSQPRFS